MNVGVGGHALADHQVDSPRAKGLVASVFAVYLIHPLVLVAFASAFQAVLLNPLLKFVIAVLLVLPLNFLVSLVLRKLPVASKIL